MLSRLSAFLLFASFAFAQFVPGRYIVELNQPVAAKTTAGVAQARQAQAPVAARLAAMGADVRDSLAATTNALIVDIPAGMEDQVKALGDVKRIIPVRIAKAKMDAAPALLQADAAWRNYGGVDRAGLGIKIGIIDTGIDQTHPAFQDSTLTPPAGFPKADTTANLAYTNNKVIVARSYASLYSRTANNAPRDLAGHGTAVAMAAAGVVHTSPRGTVSGMAPKAFLGSYRASNPNGDPSFNEDAIFKAFDDAVADGMDVINLSLGSVLALRPEDDPFTDMVNEAAARGIVVVVAAGNEGPDGMTIGDVAQPPLAIAVGATNHGRVLATTVSIPNVATFVGLPGSNSPETTAAVTAPVIDVATIDPSGQACSALPAGRLNGSIALILRGGGGGACFFSTKIQNAAAAGARGVIIYTTPDIDVAAWTAGAATTPAMMIGNADGMRLKTLVAGGTITATLNFALTAVPTDFRKLASFSSIGPGTSFAIKPDVVTIGTDVYTAHAGGGYQTVSGTSLAAPIVTGTVAFLKGARPNLTVDQYRSLIINSAQWMDGTLQQRGNGALTVDGASNLSIVAAPASVSFGISGVNANASRKLTLTNLGQSADTFSITVFPLSPGPAPTVSVNQVTLQKGESQTIDAQFIAQGLPGGERNGLFIVRGNASGAQIYVPYWHGVPTNVPNKVSLLYADDSDTSGVQTAFYFRLLDAAGMATVGTATPNVQPSADSAANGARVIAVHDLNDDSPGLWAAEIRIRANAGDSVYTIDAVGAPQTVVTIPVTR